MKTENKEVPSSIFLDLEGPIVTYDSVLANTVLGKSHYSGGSSRPNWISWTDPIALKLVYRLAIDFHSKVVLTSVLRNDRRVTGQLYHFFDQLSESEGVENPYAGETLHGVNREAEIRQYIVEHGVKKYVVIDDRDLDIENFVQVDRGGFRYPEYDKCLSYLFDETKHSPKMLEPPGIYL